MTLYHHNQVKDNCGFGLIANIDGKVSHKVVRTAITGLANMQHRGGVCADSKTGDGCGLLIQKPENFFRQIAEENNWRLGSLFGVGMFFINTDEDKARTTRDIIEQELIKETLTIVGWREVPIDTSVLGDIALQTLPKIYQILVNAQPGWRKTDLERRLYMAHCLAWSPYTKVWSAPTTYPNSILI